MSFGKPAGVPTVVSSTAVLPTEVRTAASPHKTPPSYQSSARPSSLLASPAARLFQVAGWGASPGSSARGHASPSASAARGVELSCGALDESLGSGRSAPGLATIVTDGFGASEAFTARGEPTASPLSPAAVRGVGQLYEHRRVGTLGLQPGGGAEANVEAASGAHEDADGFTRV